MRSKSYRIEPILAHLQCIKCKNAGCKIKLVSDRYTQGADAGFQQGGGRVYRLQTLCMLPPTSKIQHNKINKNLKIIFKS